MYLLTVAMGEMSFEKLRINSTKMIQCVEALETPHAGDPCWSERCKCNNSGQTYE